MSAWAVVLTSNVYLAIAQRALDLAAAVSSGRTSNRLNGRPRSEDPFVQAVLGEAVAELDAIEAHLDTAAREWTEQPVADIPWNRRLLAAKQLGRAQGRATTRRPAGRQAPRRWRS